MIIISTHAAFSNDKTPMHGTGSQIAPLLKDKKKDFVYIRHSLSGETSTLIEIDKNTTTLRYTCGVEYLPFFIRILQEQIINGYFCWKYRNENNNIYIGIDPLNAFTGILLRSIAKFEKVIFYTADYAEKRFDNGLLNSIYHGLDRFVIRHADQVWNVSRRILNKRKNQGVPDNKNIFVPNTPDITKIKSVSPSTINRYQVILVSTISSSMNYELILQAVKNLSKKFTHIKLVIIGTGPYEEELEKLISFKKMDSIVEFLGKKSHEQLIKIVSKSGIGLALYTETNPWTWYGDSMKVREYIACGVPVIMNDICSTAEDIKDAEAGIVIETGIKDLEFAIEKIFKSQKDYEKMRENALKLAKELDIRKIVLRQLSI